MAVGGGTTGQLEPLQVRSSVTAALEGEGELEGENPSVANLMGKQGCGVRFHLPSLHNRGLQKVCKYLIAVSLER